MGLLDSLTYDPQMALGMGLLSAGGPSRMPVSFGQGLASAYGDMQKSVKDKQAMDMQKMQLTALMSKQYRIDSALAQENGQPPPKPEHYGLPPEFGMQAQPIPQPSGPTPAGISGSSLQAFGLPPSMATPDQPQAPQPSQQWTPSKINAFAMSGDAGMMKAAEMAQARLLESQKPVVNRGYGIGVMNGGKYQPDQASIDQALAMERGKQGIELPYRAPVTLDTSSGQKASVFPSEFPQVKQGNLPGRLTGQPQAISNLVGDPKQIISLINQIQDPQERVAALDAYSRQLSGSKPTQSQSQAGIGTLGLSQTQADQIEQGGQKAFAGTIGSSSADELLKSRDQAKTAMETLQGIDQARQAIKGGAFQGTGAEFKLSLTKFINANVPGITINEKQAGDTDYLKSILGTGLLQQAKTLGSNPSNADATRINDIVGSIGKDPQAMTKILDWREQMANQAITRHNTTVADAESRGMKSPFDLRIKPLPQEKNWTPASSSPASAKTMSLDDIVATAKASGKTTAEVTAAAKAKGYTIK